MRVMLISPITLITPECINSPRPEVGDIDVVTEEKRSPVLGLFYSLERFGNDQYYWAELFSILPDEPEEVIEEQQPEHATA